MVQLTRRLQLTVVDDRCEKVGCTKAKEYDVVGIQIDAMTTHGRDGKELKHSQAVLLIVNDSGRLTTLYPSYCKVSLLAEL